MSDIVIVEAVRSPVGRRGGELSNIHPSDLLSEIQTALIERSGVDLDALRTRLPREFDLVAGRPADIPLDHGLRLVAGCEQLLGESNFGLRLAEKTDFRDMGIYGYLLLNAQTLGQFLELAAKYFGVLIRTSSIYFASGPRRSRFEYP